MTVEKKHEDELADLRATLRSAITPMQDTELLRDLWPDMLQRMELVATPWPVRVPWLDWALLGLAGAALFFFPALIPALLYHL